MCALHLEQRTSTRAIPEQGFKFFFTILDKIFKDIRQGWVTWFMEEQNVWGKILYLAELLKVTNFLQLHQST